ncbi:IclR family transcriptional regulator [Herbiconiux sp. SYSU D00978]|uniref:IclR family transcriptional regulator n=1 Tax=Herbiconiux sp. SYSU D00978 TaxID=2812562 RepID=UPI001A96F484|nr:helix-turn-helix domain-containing protein [Herbiconiux sp. SYSU D00978]
MSEPQYAVPALDKGLDILELLASASGTLSQSEIASAVGRSVSQIFRVLTTLERRGYVVRDAGGQYALSLRMFELAHRHPPLRGLVQAALAPMRQLAGDLRQSCNLGVIDADHVRIVASVESPAPFGYRVRVGAEFGIDEGAPGRVLLAGAPDDVRQRLGERAEHRGIRIRGHLVAPDPGQPGITDIVVPVRGADDAWVAALHVPYLAASFAPATERAALQAALHAADAISQHLGSPGDAGRR